MYPHLQEISLSYISNIFFYFIYLLLFIIKPFFPHDFSFNWEKNVRIKSYNYLIIKWSINSQCCRAIPFGTMVAVSCICIFVILPLNLVGTVLGRNLAGQPDYPCRVNAVPRPIPEKKWFMEPAIIAMLGGILPFGSIFIEMYFIFTSFWAYKIYYVYGFMLLGKLLIFIYYNSNRLYLKYEKYCLSTLCNLSSNLVRRCHKGSNSCVGGKMLSL